jgi:predicted PurR-regulated permease PerM
LEVLALATAGNRLRHPGERSAGKIADAIRATANRTMAAAIVKGAVIGVACVLTGVPHPMLFTVLTMALAMVPLGAGAAMATAVLILLVHGGTWLMTAGLANFGAATLLVDKQYVVPAAGSLLNIAQSGLMIMS